MKILFLDIDGVLNHRYSPIVGGVFTIDETLIPLLKRIIEATGAKIVLSSTWRLSPHSRAKVDSILGKHNLEIMSYTPSLKGHRSLEIKDWLERHPALKVTKYAIVDDDWDAGTNGLTDSFFQTTWETGLTVEITERIIKHLKD